MANILVTGGAGFIGSHAADALIEKGYHVEIVDNLFTGLRENVPQKAVFHEVDIRSEKLNGIFEQGNFDVVYHLAAQMDVRKSVADPAFDADANILGGINLLQNCKKHKIKKVIFSSTGGAIYGEQEVFPASENHPQNPTSPYGISKLAFEKYLQFYKLEYNLDYISLRYANIYCQRFLAGNKAVIFGDGGQTRDFTYVDDVVRANLLALDYNECGAFNVGTGIETDVNTLFEYIKTATGSTQKQFHEPALPGEQRRSVINYTAIKKAMGWRPQVDIESGLKITADYFKEKVQL